MFFHKNLKQILFFFFVQQVAFRMILPFKQYQDYILLFKTNLKLGGLLFNTEHLDDKSKTDNGGSTALIVHSLILN